MQSGDQGMAPKYAAWQHIVHFKEIRCNLVFTLVFTGHYLSPNGRDVPFCGTPLLPCKSLKSMIERKKQLVFYTVNVIHVEGKFMPCEYVVVRDNLKLTGINGRTIFNCSQSCAPFLTIFLSSKNEKIKEPNVLVKNMQLVNQGCNTSLILLHKINEVVFDNIIFKESTLPAIVVHQHSEQPMNITMCNCKFLSAHGI